MLVIMWRSLMSPSEASWFVISSCSLMEAISTDDCRWAGWVPSQTQLILIEAWNVAVILLSSSVHWDWRRFLIPDRLKSESHCEKLRQSAGWAAATDGGYNWHYASLTTEQRCSNGWWSDTWHLWQEDAARNLWAAGEKCFGLISGTCLFTEVWFWILFLWNLQCVWNKYLCI